MGRKRRKPSKKWRARTRRAARRHNVTVEAYRATREDRRR